MTIQLALKNNGTANIARRASAKSSNSFFLVENNSPWSQALSCRDTLPSKRYSSRYQSIPAFESITAEWDRKAALRSEQLLTMVDGYEQHGAVRREDGDYLLAFCSRFSMVIALGTSLAAVVKSFVL